VCQRHADLAFHYNQEKPGEFSGGSQNAASLVGMRNCIGTPWLDLPAILYSFEMAD
jgi:hypothetical protein